MSVSSPPAAENSGPPARVSASTSSSGSTTSRRKRSTPARYRLLSALTVAALALTALLGFVAATSLTDSTDSAHRNTGPVLVATQDVFASIAEADAASAALFLSGPDEDREQQRLYELALRRSTAQLEEVSRLVGDDEDAHDSIKAISSNLTTYAGLVERARLARVAELPEAEASLRDAIGVVQDGIVPQVEAITANAQGRLDDDVSGGRVQLAIAMGVALAGLAVLTAGQVFVTRRTNRLINLPLAVATLLLIITVVWLSTAWARQQNDLELARDGGYDSIALTADIQSNAFRYKTLESLALVANSTAAQQAEQNTIAGRLAAIDIDTTLVDAARAG